MVSDKEKLEGAQAKIQMLEKCLQEQQEKADRLSMAMLQIRIAYDELPENWQAKLAVGFSLVGFVETVEEVIPTISTYLPEPFPDTAHLEEIASMPTLDECDDWKEQLSRVHTFKEK